MKALLDECCPRPLGAALGGLNVVTVDEAGLKGCANGDLLQAAERMFDVLITADKNLRYQQNLKTRKIAIIELPTNSWRRLRQLAPVIRKALEDISAGQYVIISAKDC